MRGASVAALVVLLLGTGCFQNTYVVAGTTPEPDPARREWRHYLFLGLIDLSDDVELRAYCPQGVSRIETGMTWYNFLITLATATLYTTMVSEVYCQAPDELPPSEPSASDVPDRPPIMVPIEPERVGDAGADPAGPDGGLDLDPDAGVP